MFFLANVYWSGKCLWARNSLRVRQPDGHTPWSAGWKVYGPPRLSHLEMEAGIVYTSSQLVEEEKSGLWQRAGGQRVWGGCAESVFSAVTRCGWEPDSWAEWILPSIISHRERLPGWSGYGAPTGGHLHAVDSEGKVLSRMNWGGAHAINAEKWVGKNSTVVLQECLPLLTEQVWWALSMGRAFREPLKVRPRTKKKTKKRHFTSPRERLGQASVETSTHGW